MSTPSPIPRTMSLSPSSGLPPIPNMHHRHTSDYSFMTTGSLPVHLSRDMHQASPRSSPTTPTGPITSMPGSHRSSANTSHPTAYGPPPVLEPPAHQDQRQQGSPHGSPHMSNSGWQSPSHGESYMYPDPYGSSAAVGSHLYYPSSNIRRPQSTEPPVEMYETKPRLGEVWTSVS